MTFLACLLACMPTWTAPAFGRAMPENVPALVTNQPGTAIELSDAAGTRIPVNFGPDRWTGQSILSPQRALVPGSYRLHLEGCQLPSPDIPFQVELAAPIPAHLGMAIARAPERRMLTVATSDGSCTRHIEAAWTAIEIDPSRELEAFLPMASFALTVDGKPWATSIYGGYESSRLPGARRVDGVFAACDPQLADDNGLQPGTYPAQLAVHIAGADKDPPPLVFELDVRCSGGCEMAGRGAPGWSVVLLSLSIALRRFASRRRPRPGPCGSS